MKTQLESLAAMANELGRDYDPETDASKVNSIIAMLGNVFNIETLKVVMKFYQDQLNDIENNRIPDLLMEEGMSEVVTQDGLSVKLKNEYNTKILDEEGFFAWMDDNGGSSLYKEMFKFPAGEDLEVVKNALKEAGVSYEQKKDIHHMTLKKFVSDRMKDGLPIPEDLAKVGQFTHAQIKKAK